MTTDMVRPVSISATSVANRYLFSWAMGGRVYSAALDGGQWSAPKDMAKGFHRGGSYQPRITLAGDGTLLATWLQKNGKGLALLARLRVGGVWGDATMLSPFVNTSGNVGNVSGYDVASNGTDFMVASFGTGSLLQTTKCSHSGGGAWQWTPLGDISSRTSGPLRLVSNGSGYLLVGGGGSVVFANHYDGTRWSPNIQISPTNAGWVSAVDAVSDGVGYTAVFQAGYGSNQKVFARKWDELQWGAVSTLDNFSYSILSFFTHAAWDGTHYAALWTNGTTVKSSLLLDNVWSTPSTVGAGSMAGDLLGTAPGVFQAAWMQTTPPDTYAVYAATQTDGAWGDVSLLGTGSGTQRTPDPLLAQCGSSTALAWSLGGAAGDVFRTTLLDSENWGATKIWSHPGRDAWFHSIAGGSNGCDVAWTEEDPDDVAVYRLRLTNP